MDEYSTGFDPEVTRYFKKIIRSFSIGLLWLVAMATAGIFYRLGFLYHGIQWYNILYYAVALLSLAGLLMYYYRIWKD